MSETGNDLGLNFLREKGTNFPEKPKFIEDVKVFPMPDGLGIQFRGLSSPVVLKGALVESCLADLIKLLDGTRTPQELFECFRGKTTPGDIASLLMTLFTRGLISDAGIPMTGIDPVENRHLMFYGRRLGVTRHNKAVGEVTAQLSAARVFVFAEGLLGACVCDLLRRNGIGKITVATTESDDDLRVASEQMTEGEPAIFLGDRRAETISAALSQQIAMHDLVIVAARNTANSVFETVNQICISNGVDWIRVHDNGGAIDVGPYVKPYDSPCYECLVMRELSCDEYAIEEELYQQQLGKGASSSLKGEMLTLATLAASYAVMESVRVITAIEPPKLNGSIMSFYSCGNIEHSRFMRVPRCHVCSRAAVIYDAGVENAVCTS